MRQIGLFDAGSKVLNGEPPQPVMEPVEPVERVAGGTAGAGQSGLQPISFYPDFASWWSSASLCLQQKMNPSYVWWVEDRRVSRNANGSDLKVYPASMPEFAQEAKAASCHRSEDRWALLYSICWRLANHEPQLMELSGDPEVAKLRQYAKAVARDVHKMKAFVRFRKVDGESTGGSPRYVSWFEPEHHIVEYAAPFFTRRFSNMRWSILTPVGCAHWEGLSQSSREGLAHVSGQSSRQSPEQSSEQISKQSSVQGPEHGSMRAPGQLWFSDPLDKNLVSAAWQIDKADQFEDAWRVYYKSIFNPARLKISAMQSEMPKKVLEEST